MVKVGINGRVLTKPQTSGVGRYTRSLLSNLICLQDQGELSVTVTGVDKSSFIPDSIEVTDEAPVHSGFRAHIWEQFTLPRRLRDADYDVFHTPGGHPPVLSGTPLVTTIHDISPITHPEWFSSPYAVLYRVLTPLAIRGSDRIITVSEFARQEIIKTYPAAAEKTVAIYNGVDDQSVRNRTRPTQLTSDNYLLFVGSSNPRKNLRRLLEGYDEYREQSTDPPQLVLVGPERDVFATTDLPTVNGVENIGFVSESELAWLYDNAALFAYPSLYEGFGLPILEAMSAGTPVLTSNGGAMAEVAGDAAFLVNPTRPSEIAAGIQELLESEEERRAYIQKGKERVTEFTWERTARQTIDVYREVVREQGEKYE